MEILFSNIYNAKKRNNIDYESISYESLLKLSKEERKNLLDEIEPKLNVLPPSLEMAAVANYWCKKHGFKTTFFGDETSLSLYKNIEYDNFKLIPESFIKSNTKYFWSIGKLYAIRQTNNPFLHIDSDLFLTKPLPENYLKQDTVCFHNEKFVQNHIDILQYLFKIKPKESENKSNVSYNCGIMGGQDYQSWHKAIDILISFVDQNRETIDFISKKYTNDPKYAHLFYPPVLFEQIWLFQILKSFGKQISELLIINNWVESFNEVTKKSGYIHLMSHKWLYQYHCKKFVKNNNIKF